MSASASLEGRRGAAGREEAAATGSTQFGESQVWPLSRARFLGSVA